MVRLAGLEPARPKAGDFKSPVATKLHHSRVNLYKYSLNSSTVLSIATVITNRIPGFLIVKL